MKQFKASKQATVHDILVLYRVAECVVVSRNAWVYFFRRKTCVVVLRCWSHYGTASVSEVCLGSCVCLCLTWHVCLMPTCREVIRPNIGELPLLILTQIASPRLYVLLLIAAFTGKAQSRALVQILFHDSFLELVFLRLQPQIKLILFCLEHCCTCSFVYCR